MSANIKKLNNHKKSVASIKEFWQEYRPRFCFIRLDGWMRLVILNRAICRKLYRQGTISEWQDAIC